MSFNCVAYDPPKPTVTLVQSSSSPSDEELICDTKYVLINVINSYSYLYWKSLPVIVTCLLASDVCLCARKSDCVSE